MVSLCCCPTISRPFPWPYIAGGPKPPGWPEWPPPGTWIQRIFTRLRPWYSIVPWKMQWVIEEYSFDPPVTQERINLSNGPLVVKNLGPFQGSGHVSLIASTDFVAGNNVLATAASVGTWGAERSGYSPEYGNFTFHPGPGSLGPFSFVTERGGAVRFSFSSNIASREFNYPFVGTIHPTEEDYRIWYDSILPLRHESTWWIAGSMQYF